MAPPYATAATNACPQPDRGAREGLRPKDASLALPPALWVRASGRLFPGARTSPDLALAKGAKSLRRTSSARLASTLHKQRANADPITRPIRLELCLVGARRQPPGVPRRQTDLERKQLVALDRNVLRPVSRQFEGNRDDLAPSTHRGATFQTASHDALTRGARSATSRSRSSAPRRAWTFEGDVGAGQWTRCRAEAWTSSAQFLHAVRQHRPLRTFRAPPTSGARWVLVR